MHLLCVDDEANFLDLTATCLRRKLPAATIHTATRVDDAREIIEAEPIACIVSDYEMPDQNGLELLHTVRETHPELPFILFTGKGSEEIASEAISAGVTDYLQKRGPEQYDRLATRIRHAVAEYQTEHELRERVKELTAIQTISDLLIEGDGQSGGHLRQVVTHLPRSLQFPEEAVASLTIGETEFTSPEYEPPVDQLTVHDVTAAGTEVALTIGYTATTVTEADGDVFLPEERELLTTILQLVTAYLDRRRVLSDLQAADHRLNLILENTTAVMYLKDTEGRYVFVNTEYERLFDVDTEDIVGRYDEDIHPPDVAEAVQANDRRVLETGEPLEAEEQITVDGDDRTYLSLKVPALDAAGEVEGVFGVSTEITERKKREQQLEGLNRAIPRLLSAETVEDVAERGVIAAREILDLQANAIHLYDAETGTLDPVAYTDGVRELIGEPPTFREGESIAWRVFEEGAATAIGDVQADADIYNPESPIRSELHLPLGEYGILMAGSPTPSNFDTQDVTVGEILASHITTALSQVTTEQMLRERETELEAQNERLEQFASMVSHDLRNPLSVAIGNLELYREAGDESRLDTVETSLTRIQDLVTDLTALARHDTLTETHEPVSVHEVARDAWESIETRSATLSTEPCTVTGDPGQFMALFENVFRNAVGHGGDDVTVRVGPLEGGFYVEDTGDGIPPADRDSVFDHGYTTGYGGSGVGLTIVSRIAQAHNWDITLTDSPEGGARFEFRTTDSIETSDR
ncbi:PAS domain-containing protein [Halorubrum lipolyticum]|uniref:histidine kinase n=1 Tax=Halorubrum lipolyticum DSM 21995 TaxID=1227482 RepID=M0NP67_9EURY|nr:PAS domain-containing protein [Halorubrum lipolyticum]EMA59752.1 multi-sensor signal transduction histidine kinase [Halorubrum lipolyticum DSM 21995]